MSFIQVKQVRKEYGDSNSRVIALSDCSFDIEQGEFVVILGPSGAGKTTALNILGGMDTATSGRVFVDGQAVHEYSRKELIAYRRNDIGFVFQFYNLVGNLTALENVELACQVAKNHLEPKKILRQVGLEKRMNNFPSQLSGGEQQRVAIARAIAKNAKLLLCDEPTGALDSTTGQKIIELLHHNCKKWKTTTVVITHNSAIAAVADKIVRVKNGTVEDVTVNKQPALPSDIKW